MIIPLAKIKTYKATGKILLLLLLVPALFGCGEKQSTPENKNNTGTLVRLGVFPLNISEPSGLTFGSDDNTLLTVSDQTAQVYQIDFKGNILKKFAYKGEDLEGIGYDPDTKQIAVAEERQRDIVFLDLTTGKELRRYHINIPKNLPNKGIEGLAFNSNNKKWYLLNEAQPGLLCVWSASSGLIEQKELNFAADYSGIYVDTKNSLLWIVSDESKTLFKCDYNANVLKKYPLDKNKYEGVAVDAANQIVYLVNDGSSELYVYQIENK